MKKYLMLISLILVGLTMAMPPRAPDDWTYYKFEIAFCKAQALQDAFDGFADPNCMSQSTYGQLATTMEQLNGDGGAVDQLLDTTSAGIECRGDPACLARYRLQFRSQQSTFNALMSNGLRLAVVAGREAMRPPYNCITPQQFSQYYMMYTLEIMGCNGGGAIITP